MIGCETMLEGNIKKKGNLKKKQKVKEKNNEATKGLKRQDDVVVVLLFAFHVNDEGPNKSKPVNWVN